MKNQIKIAVRAFLSLIFEILINPPQIARYSQFEAFALLYQNKIRIQVIKKPFRFNETAFYGKLGARYIFCAWSFFSFHNVEAYGVANFQFAE